MTDGSGVRPPHPSSEDSPAGPWHLVAGCVVVGIGMLVGWIGDTESSDTVGVAIGAAGALWALVGAIAVGVRVGLADFHGNRGA